MSADRRYTRASPAQSRPASDGVAVLILTREQRRDVVRALVEAIDNSQDDAATARWSALIPLVDSEAAIEEGS